MLVAVAAAMARPLLTVDTYRSLRRLADGSGALVGTHCRSDDFAYRILRRRVEPVSEARLIDVTIVVDGEPDADLFPMVQNIDGIAVPEGDVQECHLDRPSAAEPAV